MDKWVPDAKAFIMEHKLGIEKINNTNWVWKSEWAEKNMPNIDIHFDDNTVELVKMFFNENLNVQLFLVDFTTGQLKEFTEDLAVKNKHFLWKR